jgi:hypothetical protein
MSKYSLRKASRSADDIKEAVKALNEEFNSYNSAAHVASDPEFVYKAAELVRQLAQESFMMIDPTDMMLDRIAGPALGDWMEFEEFVNTAKVVERSLGGKPRVYTPHKLVYNIQPTDWRLDFGFELEQVATGQLDTQIWVEQMAEATEVESTTIDPALKRLGEVNPDVTIAGRYATLFPIFGLATGEVALEEFRQRGAIARYKGANIVVLRDNYNRFFNETDIPADRIYLMGAEKGGVLAETDMSAMNYNVIDQEELHFRVGTKGRTAFKVFKPWKYHVIEIT